VDTLIRSIATKKSELDERRRRAPRGLTNFEHAHNLELTYTSNAIEGNTLTAPETMLVIEQGITIGGKPLKDHLEAIDHHEAVLYIRTVGKRTTPLTEMDVRTLHNLVVKRSSPDIAGRYADQGRFIVTNTGRHAFPSPAEVPALMGDFAKWLTDAPPTPEEAFEAHRNLVNIHPFNDGNGRTARLLMNLMLIRGAYPPIAIRPEDRPAYLAALQAQATDQGAAFIHLMHERLDATLDEYIGALNQALPTLDPQSPPQ
jgi:Fic family protein